MAAELQESLEQTLERLKAKRDRLVARMKDDEEKVKIMGNRSGALVSRLQKVTKRMNHRITAKKEYEKAIMETEGSYTKIVDNSKELLKVLQGYVGDDDSDADELIEGKDPGEIGGTMDVVNDDGNLNTAALGK